MVEITLNIAMGFLLASFVVAFFRLVKGPSIVDRLLAVETTTLVVLGVIAGISLRSSSELFIVVLILAIMGVISSVAVAKYLVKGDPF
ncbi:K+/H+ antiporter subunit F [SAR202 cluster bacterium AD-804-J14_MRT_500m]|nr:K+/H+ antiporter subunit F [SAR202 cluster bacterium AD-804-J14_MRT_500m]